MTPSYELSPDSFRGSDLACHPGLRLARIDHLLIEKDTDRAEAGLLDLLSEKPDVGLEIEALARLAGLYRAAGKIELSQALVVALWERRDDPLACSGRRTIAGSIQRHVSALSEDDTLANETVLEVLGLLEAAQQILRESYENWKTTTNWQDCAELEFVAQLFQYRFVSQEQGLEGLLAVKSDLEARMSQGRIHPERGPQFLEHVICKLDELMVW